jgi:RNA polymerase sigma factor (sigma-70 family)
MYVVATDSVLLRRFAEQGDEGAFSELVRRHAGMVFATCRRVLGDAARAEDVAQETFLRLLRKPDSVTHSVGGWLYTAASQLSIDVARSESARRHREAAYVAKVEANREVEEPAWKAISPHVDAALMELPEDTRMLLVQHFLEGRSQTEIAKECGTSVSTISRHIRHGVEMLRVKLGRKGITIAAVLLAECLALDTTEAAPSAMLHGLGKMAMLSGARAQPPIPYHPPQPLTVHQFVGPKVLGKNLAIAAMGAVGAVVLGALFTFAWEQSRQSAKPIIDPPKMELRR